jgi:hypothetical protein
LFQGAAKLLEHAGAVHEDVDLTEVLDGLVKDAFAFGLDTDIRRDAERLRPKPLEGALDCAFVHVADADAGTSLAGKFSHRKPDSACTARYQENFVAKVEADGHDQSTFSMRQTAAPTSAFSP